MSWSESIKKARKAGTSPVPQGSTVRTAGIFSEQDRQRQAMHNAADQLPRYAGENTAGKQSFAAEGTLFTNGELNAWDRKDALAQLDKAVLPNMEKVRSAGVKKAAELDSAEREEMLRWAYSDRAEDRARFASAPMPIVYRQYDYIGLTGDILQEYQIPQGVVPYVEKDIDVPAFVVAKDGQVTKSDIKGDRAYYDMFQLESLVTVSMQEVAERSWSIIDRIFEKVPRQMALEEDRMMVRGLKAASGAVNTQLLIPGGTLDKNTIEAFAVQIERWRLDADKFLLNRQDFSGMRTSIRADEFDPITSRDVFVTGAISKYLGYNIVVTAGIDQNGVNNEIIPRGHIFAVSSPRFVGTVGVRIPLTVMNADQMVFGGARYGWLYYKLEGIIITNPRAVAFGQIDPATNPTPAWLA